MKKIIPLILLLLVVAAGAVLLYKPVQAKRAEAARTQALQRQMVPLQQEKREKLNQMAQLQRQYDGKMQVKSTVQLFFSGAVAVVLCHRMSQLTLLVTWVSSSIDTIF